MSADAPLGKGLHELVTSIGEAAALEISIRHGGRRLYVPTRPVAGGELAATVGLEKAVALSAAHPGSTFHIPYGVGRRVRIVRLRTAGNSVREIAMTLGCSERHVWHVLAEARKSGEAAFLRGRNHSSLTKE